MPYGSDQLNPSSGNEQLDPTPSISLDPQLEEWVEEVQVALGLSSADEASPETDGASVEISDAQLKEPEQSSAEDIEEDDDEGDEEYRAYLEQYLDIIQDHLDKGTQLPANMAASADRDIMYSLVDLANEKEPGLNADFCEGPDDMVSSIAEMIKNDEKSARFIVTMKGGIHFATFDYSLVDGKPSVIGIEPASVNTTGGAMLAIQTQSAFKDICPEASVSIIESDLQRSNGECGMYSLALAKKMFKEKEHFEKIHEQNRNDLLPKSIGVVVGNDASDDLLPPSMMKHAQSPNRMGRYLRKHPSVEDLKINKRGETLKERQARYTIDMKKGEKTVHYSTSIEHKRKKEVHRLKEEV